ncbi:MBL fold metallo-hydrolase (plasmid) [Rhodococcus aetherivorans]|uniref:MBL fold metallo-hydrolase n=1 Tax=Rhodococcus aetherivorans TaxID=191292 RepID=UPI0026F33B84|nr:MBL fold metallo-hydrolase [Rhodococcus aetherivorans]WKX01746.1 MBL fold metallo-hydrolase [Rhodococcus aetherivorans]
MTDSTHGPLPDWLIWQHRPFPDANLLLITGREPALIDSGFVGHAADTAAWVDAHTRELHRVVNTHWHADHVGGNALLQDRGVGIAASVPDAAALARRDPGCCLAEYLDQPVAPYTVDEPLPDGRILRLGDTDWQVVSTPGHTPGHLALWQPDHGLLIVGDALSDYDVGWVNLALDGPDAAAAAAASLRRLTALAPRVVLPAHGPIPLDPAAALADAQRRADRLVADPDGAVWYGLRRIFAYALMIRNGIGTSAVEAYLHARAWLIDAATLLHTDPEALAAELVGTMLRNGAIVVRHGRLHAAAEHSVVPPGSVCTPFPRAWPAPGDDPAAAQRRLTL